MLDGVGADGIADALLEFFFGVVESRIEARTQYHRRPQGEYNFSHSSCCLSFFIKKADPKIVEPALVVPEKPFWLVARSDCAARTSVCAGTTFYALVRVDRIYIAFDDSLLGTFVLAGATRLAVGFADYVCHNFRFDCLLFVIIIVRLFSLQI
jgi:hypothetical protein